MFRHDMPDSHLGDCFDSRLMFLPVVLAVIAIPQLLFFWLAPANIPARLTVYGFGTLLTAAVPLLTGVMLYRFGYCLCSGLLACSVVLEVLTLASCGLLLALDVSVRTAVCSLSILVMVHLICLSPLCHSICRRRLFRGPVSPFPDVRFDDSGDFRPPAPRHETPMPPRPVREQDLEPVTPMPVRPDPPAQIL